MSGLLSVSVAGKDFSGSIVTSEHLVMDYELPPNTEKIFRVALFVVVSRDRWTVLPGTCKCVLLQQKRKLPFGELQTGQCVLSVRDEFRVNTVLVIIDTLKSELKKRAAA